MTDRRNLSGENRTLGQRSGDITRTKDTNVQSEKWGNLGQDMEDGKVPGFQKKGFCFVATAVYGSADAQEVIFLKYYRDNVLKKSFLGRLFITWYYDNGYNLAKFVEKRLHLKQCIKVGLDLLFFHLQRRFK